MKRYFEDHHGDDHFMTESEDGDWVRWEDVAQERRDMNGELPDSLARRVEVAEAELRQLSTVTAMGLSHWKGRAEGLQQACTEAGQRIAALEAEVARLREADATATEAIDTLTAMHATAARSAAQWHDKYATAEAALDQARVLLESISCHTFGLPGSLGDDLRTWLRAHPAAATAAATGADSFTTRHGDVIDLGEKERAP